MPCCQSETEKPDYAAQARQGAEANAKAFKLQREIDTAALRGEKVIVNGVEYDFTGTGEADYNAKYADQMAKAMLDLQKDLGPEFIKQRLAELEAADPEGVAARKKLFTSILDQNSKVGSNLDDATSLQNSILDELQKGGELPEDYASDVRQAVLGNQVARGNFLGNAAATQEAGAMLTASDQLRKARQDAAMELLQSGATPEDIRFRENQQAISNLTSFMNGASPTAQFQGLQGAQQGAAPWQSSAPGKGIGNDTDSAARFSQSVWNTQMSDASNQANPWISGLSLGIKGATVYNQAKGGGSGGPMAGKYGGGSSWG